jgi:hypothetical protein
VLPEGLLLCAYLKYLLEESRREKFYWMFTESVAASGSAKPSSPMVFEDGFHIVRTI